jgi:hypothetical protein
MEWNGGRAMGAIKQREDTNSRTRDFGIDSERRSMAETPRTRRSLKALQS